MYGSNRLGIFERADTLAISAFTSSSFDADGFFDKTGEALATPPTASATEGIAFMRGDKRFELSNHLGNTISILTDRKLQVADAGLSLGYYFTGDVIAARDYYPFGMLMPERNMADDGYSYGFNGKESDDEVSWNVNQYNDGFRIYSSNKGFLIVNTLSTKCS